MFGNGCNITCLIKMQRNFTCQGSKAFCYYHVQRFNSYQVAFLLSFFVLNYFFDSDLRLGWFARLVRMLWLMCRGSRSQLGIGFQGK